MKLSNRIVLWLTGYDIEKEQRKIDRREPDGHPDVSESLMPELRGPWLKPAIGHIPLPTAEQRARWQETPVPSFPLDSPSDKCGMPGAAGAAMAAVTLAYLVGRRWHEHPTSPPPSPPKRPQKKVWKFD